MRIDKYLLSKGVKPELKGFDYMVDAINLCIKDKSYLRGLTTRLYPEIAKINNDVVHKVERALRHVIDGQKPHVTIGRFIAISLIELIEG